MKACNTIRQIFAILIGLATVKRQQHAGSRACTEAHGKPGTRMPCRGLLILAIGCMPAVGQADPVVWSENGNSYEFIFANLTWTQANAAAQAKILDGRPGHLVTITSAAENDFVANLVGGDFRAWIGLTDTASEGNFQWVTGEPLSFTRWSPGEPNNFGGNEDYVEMFNSNDSWNDRVNTPFTPSIAAYIIEWEAPEPFEIVVIPDTQLYAQTNSPIFEAQAQWILDNREDNNIVYVAHLGDLKDSGGPNAAVSCDDVDLGGGFTEWAYVSQALSKLEDPVMTGLPEGLPVGVLPGNHDFDQGENTFTCPSFNPRDTNPDGRPLTLYEARLGDDHFETSPGVFKSFYGGSRPPDPVAEPNISFTGDSYTLFSAGGIDFISINLGFRHTTAPSIGPTADLLVDNPEIKWANDLLAANKDRLGIVTSHFFLWSNNSQNGTNQFGPWAGSLYTALSDNKNLFMMLSAHQFGEAYRVEARSDMQPVHILLSDYQQTQYPGANATSFNNLQGFLFVNGVLANGNSGFMRSMRFDPANGVVDITTFAPPVSDLGRTTTLTSNYAPFNSLVIDGALSAADIATINSSTSMNPNTASNLRILLDPSGYLSSP